jgi:hypothetical protein
VIIQSDKTAKQDPSEMFSMAGSPAAGTTAAGASFPQNG